MNELKTFRSFLFVFARYVFPFESLNESLNRINAMGNGQT